MEEAINDITVNMFNTIERGDSIDLKNNFTLYRYIGNGIVRTDLRVVIDSNDNEVLQVMLDGKGGLIFEEL